jgi:hypothetical protein
VLNLMVCGPQAFFLEHFKLELRRESAINLFAKLVDCKHRLRAMIRKPIDGFLVSPINDDDPEVTEICHDGDDNVIARQSATRDSHFNNAPMF